MLATEPARRHLGPGRASVLIAHLLPLSLLLDAAPAEPRSTRRERRPGLRGWGLVPRRSPLGAPAAQQGPGPGGGGGAHRVHNDVHITNVIFEPARVVQSLISPQPGDEGVIAGRGGGGDPGRPALPGRGPPAPPTGQGHGRAGTLPARWTGG